MKTSKFSETQIIAILKEAEAGIPVKEVWTSQALLDTFEPLKYASSYLTGDSPPL